MSNELTRHVEELLSVLQKLIKTKVDLLKLTVIEKSSGFASFIFSTLFAVVVAALMIGFGAAAFTVWYGETYHNYVTGLLISMAILFIVAVIFFLIGRKLLGSVVIKNLIEVLFEDKDDKEPEK